MLFERAGGGRRAGVPGGQDDLERANTDYRPWRVFSLDRYARDAPDTPADEVLTDDERQVIGLMVRAEGLLPPAERGRPFPPDIRSWVVLLARMAGWQPSKRRPLPGNEVLWRAFVQLQMMVRVTQAARAP